MAVKTKQTAPVKPVQPFVPAPVANERIEQIGNSLEGKGKLILYVLGGILALLILAGIFYAYQSRTTAAAQTALGKAIEISTAQVSASPIPGSVAPVFATEKERAEKAVAAFEDVASKHASPYRDQAKYFAAVNRLTLDRAAGLNELQTLTTNSNRETANLAKFALAEASAADGKYDQAAGLYTDLAKQPNLLIPVDTINFALAGVYEKQNKTAEAADVYFNIAKQAREAKDQDGKPVTLTATAREAATKLEKLDAAKFAQLPPEPTLTEF